MKTTRLKLLKPSLSDAASKTGIWALWLACAWTCIAIGQSVVQEILPNVSRIRSSGVSCERPMAKEGSSWWRRRVKLYAGCVWWRNFVQLIQMLVRCGVNIKTLDVTHSFYVSIICLDVFNYRTIPRRNSNQATGWTIRASNPGRCNRFICPPNHPDRHRDIPNSLFNGYLDSFLGVKWPGPEADLPPSSTEVKNEWSYISTPLCTFMAWTRTTLHWHWHMLAAPAHWIVDSNPTLVVDACLELLLRLCCPV
jgi:hypothetical protein